MKKLLIFLFYILISKMLCAQNLQSYVQLSVGYTPSYVYMPPAKAYVISGEYGKTYKWLDVGISFDRENGLYPLTSDYYLNINYLKSHESNPPMYIISGDDVFKGKIVTAFRLNVKVDLIQLFISNSRHAFKIGCGYGVEFVEDINSYDESVDNITWWYHISRGWTGTGKATYEFAITPKISLGAFYYYGVGDAYGLSIRRNF
ncbi:hypothetical protein FACS1894182_09110 [Bacteroidia bacterium]|nr:hypothetical protein FACS1894182_09110 [Bacteroidia bacterium]